MLSVRVMISDAAESNLYFTERKSEGRVLQERQM